MINLFQPSVGDDELAAIKDVFSSSWLGPGDRVEQFEQAFGDYIGRPPSEVLAVSSCTEGLFQTVVALGLGPGDEVILPSISFIGAAHAVRSSGARVVLCDVDPATLNPTVEHVERAITRATRAALIIHYGGAPGALVELSVLAETRSLLLIEDAALALGSFVSERACGTFGDVGVWSFDSMKVLTTGDGGMVWCKSDATADRVRSSVRLGVGSSGFGRRTASSRWWEMDPPTIGRKGTMNDVAAAMGLVQLERLPGFLRRRSEISTRYDEALVDLPWVRPSKYNPGEAARMFYWVQTAPELRDRLAAHLLERQIYTSFRYWPLHKTRMYRSNEAFPGADHAAESTLLLPLHQGLSDSDIERVLDAIRGFAP
jgi:aminotransferase